MTSLVSDMIARFRKTEKVERIKIVDVVTEFLRKNKSRSEQEEMLVFLYREFPMTFKMVIQENGSKMPIVSVYIEPEAPIQRAILNSEAHASYQYVPILCFQEPVNDEAIIERSNSMDSKDDINRSKSTTWSIFSIIFCFSGSTNKYTPDNDVMDYYEEDTYFDKHQRQFKGNAQRSISFSTKSSRKSSIVDQVTDVASKNLKRVASLNPLSSENLNMVAELNPITTTNLNRVAELNPITTENFNRVSELNPITTENLKRIASFSDQIVALNPITSKNFHRMSQVALDPMKHLFSDGDFSGGKELLEFTRELNAPKDKLSIIKDLIPESQRILKLYMGITNAEKVNFDWELTASKDGVNVWNCDIPSSSFKAMKSQCKLKKNKYTVLKYMLDDDGQKQYDDSLERYEVC